jgi:hypothetical protein
LRVSVLRDEAPAKEPRDRRKQGREGHRADDIRQGLVPQYQEYKRRCWTTGRCLAWRGRLFRKFALISSDEDPADLVSLVLTLASVGADTSWVEDHRNVEAWADTLLEQHRTTPGAGRGARRADHNALDREPLVMRLLIKLSVKLSGVPPDPEMLARMQQRRERFPTLQWVDTLFMWIAIVVLCAVVYAAFNLSFF